ncbi:Mon2p Ecym_3526 [Eremothecium cymbalariae DBVPG|uniref:Uncharacterized protein n=1 Tax=Eremothecium cymbalariae (strain CBS 270.75 / DBVPG 7215 / KCTC 17166 / NRRL Y-17582) TaxID=931890 RepID=G8JQM0_ERECY|nr:Hypothetical protein Ecym_3526 [Eremothecium cymbalariae DBVPG\
MASSSPFAIVSRQLYQDLNALSSESKRRNSEVKHASDKSLQILRIVHSFQELERHPDFVHPFVLSCKSGNAKFTTLSMQCLQRLAIHRSISKEQIEPVLEALIDSTQLAVEIQLKVLQIVPIFFKTYGKFITGPLCAKLLFCCSTVLLTPSKAPVVVGTASATLKQLISDVFERLKYSDNSDEEYSVFTSNNDTIKVNNHRYDANMLFTDLCSVHSTHKREVSLLDTNCVTEEYGLELLETVLLNYESLFLKYDDLLFLLRTKAVPLLLRSVSSSKSFPIVMRSSRCITLLIKVQSLSLLELELEVILSLLIHTLSPKSESQSWRRVLILEIFKNISSENDLIPNIFKAYDMHESRKNVISTFLDTVMELLNSQTYAEVLQGSSILLSSEQPLISSDNLISKLNFLDLLDKTSPPSVEHSYVIYLILMITNSISNSIGSKAVQASNDEDDDTLSELAILYQRIFPNLFDIHKTFLYSSTLDNALFHNFVRAFQKLAHAAGILQLSSELNKCLRIFCLATIENKQDEENIHENLFTPSQPSSNAAVVLTAISDTFRGTPTNVNNKKEPRLQSRNFYQRNIIVFRALISLSISLGPTLSQESWNYLLLTWQWTSYYVYGPTQEFLDTSYGKLTPPGPKLNKSDISVIESNGYELFESTASYTHESFTTFLTCLIDASLRGFKKSTVVFAIDTFCEDPKSEIPECFYNRLFYVDKINDLIKFNITRFTDSDSNQEIWTQLVDFMVGQIADRSLSNSSLRLYLAGAFMDAIKMIATETERLQQDQNLKFDLIGEMLLNALMKLINTIMTLEITTDNIFSGVINTEFDIVFEALRTLKELLDNFGENLKSSWSTVFKVLLPLFPIINRSYDIIGMEGKENTTILDAIQQKHRDMVQISFEVFKLISDDFLQLLPINVVKDVIDTLLQFVQQERDLNISFSSISQFWLVGDYLRTILPPRESNSDTAVEHVSSVTSNVSAEKSSEESFDTLWIYLLKALVMCTSDNRLEVKKGAIQTFFRIVDSYSSSFPPWELISDKVMKPLLSLAPTIKEYDSYSDFLSVTLQGLIQLYSTHFSNFKNHNWDTEWSWLFEFMGRLQCSQSFEARFVVYRSLEELLILLDDIEDVPQTVVQSCYQIWSTYNVIYSELFPSNEKKRNNIDCLEQLISCFTPMYKLLAKFDLITIEKIEECLTIFNIGLRYPLLPEYVSDKKKPSSLQARVLSSVEQFKINQPAAIEILVWYQLSSIIVLPFETRQRIEKKLSEKLSSSTKSRIPTFEAISYQASIILKERIENSENFSEEFLNRKYLLKTLKNLYGPVKNKSMVTANDKDVPLWVLSSRCFRNIFKFVFSLLKDSADKHPKDNASELLELYISTMISPLERIDKQKDIQTEEFDITEYQSHRDLLLKYIDLPLLTVKHFQPYVSSLWSSSFYYESDEIEDHLIKTNATLQEITCQLANFDFDGIVGSTQDSRLLSKFELTTICIDDLINFCKSASPGYDLLRTISVPFLVSRVAFVLRRYITEESLLNRAPLPKIKRLELVKILFGLNDVLEFHRQRGNTDEGKRSLLLLYPLLLKTIPLSHKVDELQDILQRLSLKYNALFT